MQHQPLEIEQQPSNTHTMSSHSLMYFHFGYQETILFEFWRTTTPLSYLFSCSLIFCMAVFYEWLLTYRYTIVYKQKNRDLVDFRYQKVFLYVSLMILSYLLMLTVMTYNLGLSMCVFSGLTLGYFLYGGPREVINTVVNEEPACH
eukprot:TRINITY_DN4404_c0_g1_i2.p1 TRINITY_DN4404_c0_g1~~TRINITY_DN4404_c0_g1_i2.p1  ORF type:complete len:146 (-),score=10.25 TRINITY_DN4404_c0_g1_i2:141-578(-)